MWMSQTSSGAEKLPSHFCAVGTRVLLLLEISSDLAPPGGSISSLWGSASFSSELQACWFPEWQ